MQFLPQNLAFLHRQPQAPHFETYYNITTKDWEGWQANPSTLTLETLQHIAAHFEVSLEKLLFGQLKPFDVSAIRLFLLDVDGVMTDGGMYYSEDGNFQKKFHAKDGLALRRAIKTGLEIGFITSSTNIRIVTERAKTLHIPLVHVGEGKKVEIVEGWLKERNLEWKNLAYIGDDLNDMEVMLKAGLSVCPADAVRSIRKIAHIILEKKGGEGCVREMVEDVLDIRLEDWGTGQEKQ
jgi:YrbI family 3-deoxy-D-manno-octulosonate 8-phosphate phosphatase